MTTGDDEGQEGRGGFISRWSQRKAAARNAVPDATPPVSPAGADDDRRPVEDLPPIESLQADSDFSPFLRKTVPESVRRAALRKLWVTEPSVVNYRPLVEYAWHDNEPGFGPLLPTDDVAKLLRQALGFGDPPPVEQEPAAPEGPAPEGQPGVAIADAGPASDHAIGDSLPLAAGSPAIETETGLPAHDVAVPLPRRRHGSALPD